jgi:cytochrome c553
VTTRTSIVSASVVSFVLGAAAMRLVDQRRVPLGAAPPPSAVAILESRRSASINFDDEPLWAYGFTEPPKPGDQAQPQAPPTSKPRPNQDLDEQTRPRRIDGSAAAFSLIQIRDLHNVVDWFPGDHPPMTPIIAHGPAAMADAARGCGSCHLPNGRGRPENAPTGGLPVAYFVRQIDDFRHGLRYSADPRKPNTNTMIDLAKAMSDAEALSAADYFASIAPPAAPWIRVVESDTAPRVRYVGNLALPAKEPGTEPLSGRIVEMPEDEEQGDTLRNPRSGFVAYVPPGSIARGEELVTTGGMKIVGDRIVPGRTTACGTCHGTNLTGVVGADVPPIAGRSPSYLVRQMWDIKQGARNGSQAQLMKLIVANLTPDDLLAIAAYVASRPQSAPPTAAPTGTH